MARTSIVRVTCDKCGALCKDGMFGTVCVNGPSYTDAAGDTDCDQEQVDLCVLCLTKALSVLIQGYPEEERRRCLVTLRGARRV